MNDLARELALLKLGYLDDAAVLAALDAAGESRTAATVGVCGLSTGSVARALGRLESGGYVRTTNRFTRGRRRLLYEATADGRAALAFYRERA